MYLTEKLVLLIEAQLDTPLLFPNILVSQSDGSDVDNTTYTLVENPASDVAAGDPDVDAALAEMVGEEAVGGTAPTPDQNVVEEVAGAAGVSFADNHPVQVSTWLNRFDEQRWELDPASAEDLGDRN